MILVHPPTSIPGRYEIPIGETLEMARSLNTGNPNVKAAVLERAIDFARNLEVPVRYWNRTLEEVIAMKTIKERTEAAIENLIEIGKDAIEGALSNAALTAKEIDVLIVSNSSNPIMPSLGHYWMNAMGMREDINILPFTQLACQGGAATLGAVFDILKPGQHAMVVIAEQLNAGYQGVLQGKSDLIHDTLYSDLTVAVAVTASETPVSGRGVLVRDCWRHTVRGTETAYHSILQSKGIRFTSDGRWRGLIDHTLDSLAKHWGPGGDEPQLPDVVFAHPGSEKILRFVQQRLNRSGIPCNLEHSYAVYRDGGNQGGGTLLEIIRRYLEEPVNGETWMALAVGPGFSATALRGAVFCS